jgi:hypothetical protein
MAALVSAQLSRVIAPHGRHPNVGERLEIDIFMSRLLAALLSKLAPHLFRDLGGACPSP